MLLGTKATSASVVKCTNTPTDSCHTIKEAIVVTNSISWNRINQSSSQCLNTSETQLQLLPSYKFLPPFSKIVQFSVIDGVMKDVITCEIECTQPTQPLYDFWFFFLSQHHCLYVNASMGWGVSRNIHRQISSLLKIQLASVIFFMQGVWQ